MAGKNWNMDKSQRMQMKLHICLLGILLLLLLLIGKLITFLAGDGEAEPPEPIHIPVVENFTNVWVMEADETGVKVFRDGQEYRYAYGPEYGQKLPVGSVEQVADVTVTDGTVTDIKVKKEKINGKILSANDSYIEVEGYGKLELDSAYKGYRLYKTLQMCTYRDIHFGYADTDLVLDQGKVCGVLLVKEDAMENIRVLIKSADYGGLFHEEVKVSADTDFTVSFWNAESGVYESEQYQSGEELSIASDSPLLAGGRVIVTPEALTGKLSLLSVNRSQGIPGYRGSMELVPVEEGIVVVNEVLLEEYLYSVVPSEMPASYPAEALQAQAVCARTYAYGHMLQAAYPQYGAHVDDSTSYQVYNNILEQASTTTAVKETYGWLLYTNQGEIAETYYYSTSCGLGSDANVWKTEVAPTLHYLVAKPINQSCMTAADSDATMQGAEVQDAAMQDTEAQDTMGYDMAKYSAEEEFRAHITGRNEEDFEAGEGWYRWKYRVDSLDVAHMYEIIEKRYQANTKLVLTYVDGEYVSEPMKEFSKVYGMHVAKRGAGGIADELVINTDAGTYKIITEHNIRYVLNDGESKIERQDGSKVASPNILPSAFFVIDLEMDEDDCVGYTLTGGGFGHGVGMSQNAAKAMANQGYQETDILSFFYENCVLHNIYKSNEENEL